MVGTGAGVRDTVAVGSAGAANAALLALQILGVSDATIAKKLHAFKQYVGKKFVF